MRGEREAREEKRGEQGKGERERGERMNFSYKG